MQALQRLLLDRFDLHRHDVRTARRFQQCRRIGSIGLVAFDVSTDVARRQQTNLDAQRLNLPRPIVCAAAGFHHDQPHIAVGKEAFELRARQAMLLDDAPVRIGHGDLEDTFCEINGHGCSIHHGLLLVALTLTPHDASWHDDADRSGGVHPITGSDSHRRSAFARGTAAALGMKWKKAMPIVALLVAIGTSSCSDRSNNAFPPWDMAEMEKQMLVPLGKRLTKFRLLAWHVDLLCPVYSTSNG